MLTRSEVSCVRRDGDSGETQLGRTGFLPTQEGKTLVFSCMDPLPGVQRKWAFWGPLQGSNTGKTPPASTQRPEHLGTNVPGCVDPRRSKSRGLRSGGLWHPPKMCQGCSGPESTPTCPQCSGHTLWVCTLSPFVGSIAGHRAKRSTEASSVGPSSQPVTAPLPTAALLVASSLCPTCSFLPTLLRALVYGPNTELSVVLPEVGLWGGVQTVLSAWSGNQSPCGIFFP